MDLDTYRGVVDGSDVILGGGAGRLVRLDLESGRLRWERKISSSFWGRELVRGGDILYAAPAGLVAVDVRTGAVLWSYGQHLMRPPAVDGPWVYTASQFGTATRLAAASGTVDWEVDLEEAVFAPAVGDGLVIVGTRSFADLATRAGPFGVGRVVALSALDGQVMWDVPVPGTAVAPTAGGVVATPLIVDGMAIVGTMSSRALGIRLTDGAVLWEHSDGGHNEWYSTGAVRFGSLAVFLRADGLIEALDIQTGERVWTAGAAGGSVIGRPHVVGANLYVVVHGSLRVIDGQGTSRHIYGRSGAPSISIGPTVDPAETVAIAFEPRVGGSDVLAINVR